MEAGNQNPQTVGQPGKNQTNNQIFKIFWEHQLFVILLQIISFELVPSSFTRDHHIGPYLILKFHLDGDNGQEEQVNFMMGQARDETTKTKTKADRKIGDDRISEVKGVDGTRNIKNERDKFTVDLRKKKR